VAYYFRVTTTAKRERIPLGAIPYRMAVQRATELSQRYQGGTRDLYDTLKEERAERVRQRAKAKNAKDLGDLLMAYVAQLERSGKKTAKEVRTGLMHNVADAWPKLWSTPLDEITTDNLVDVVGKVASAGRTRTAGKLRAYIRAAYSAAIKAHRDAAALPALRELHITVNPAASIAPLGNSGTRDRALSVAELRAYWRRIEALPGIDGALLRFHLLTGGQRLQQLARVTLDDYDRDAKALRLMDIKGRRTEPRTHMVPLIQPAIDAMHVMQGGPFLFTTTAGKSGASWFLVAKRLERVVDAMEKAGELEHGPFTLGDLRRTIETRLAAAKISKDVRAHLQSHGLGGVQERNYNRYDFLEEKRAALEALYRIATGASADVVPISRKA
jgi:hypothetical protein